jgi:hypothetical protein
MKKIAQHFKRRRGTELRATGVYRFVNEDCEQCRQQSIRLKGEAIKVRLYEILENF